jgi:hypothetical protein
VSIGDIGGGMDKSLQRPYDYRYKGASNQPNEKTAGRNQDVENKLQTGDGRDCRGRDADRDRDHRERRKIGRAHV